MHDDAKRVVIRLISLVNILLGNMVFELRQQMIKMNIEKQPNCSFSTPRVINVERTLSDFTIMMVMLQCGTVMTLIIYNTISHITQPWWLHYMETFSALLALCAGNSPVTGEFPHKGQWCRALMFSLICAWIRGWVNNREAGDLRCHRTYDRKLIMLWQ